jgi:glutamate 5-kinase
MRTKLAAARIAMGAGIEVVIASSAERDVLMRIAAGERVGTHFAAQAHPLGGKKSWVAFSARCDGIVWVDHGAAAALLHSSGSLLLPGITRVDGDFHEGSVVEVRDPDGRAIAKGTVNFSAADLRLLLAQRRAGAGAHHVPEVVHRNDMVVLGGVAI